MDTTANLALPYILASQAQKHVTHNEAVRALDALVQISVLDRDVATPPATPAEGDRYIVAADATGAWAGYDGKIAAWQDAAWMFYTPMQGWVAWVADEAILLAFDGAAWVAALRNAPMLGINATADATNRLALASAASLFTHDGAGHQQKINKAAASDTASQLYQTDFSGRAEFGLTGDDDFHVKVSPDGAAWKEALIADRTSGAVRFPNGLEHPITGTPLASLLLTPGGDGEVSIFRMDKDFSTPHAQNPRTATIDGIAGDVINLGSAVSYYFFHPNMEGVSYARIWNTSKDPDEAAWVKAVPDWAGDFLQLQVTDAADIAGWANGDTIQIGDPDAPTGNGRTIALDISPMMEAVLGSVFPQSGIVAKGSIQSGTVGSNIDCSGAGGVGGSFMSLAHAADATSVWHGTTVIPCSELSPISNSNLLFVRETSAGNIVVSLMSSIALIV